MGGCCSKKEDRISREFSKLGKTFKSIVTPVADDGSEVMNAIAGELFPTMAQTMLDTAKKTAYPVKPYEMHIVSGNIGKCPHIRDVKLTKGDPGVPVEFTCEVIYEGKPELKFQLKGEPGSFASHLLPPVLVELHTISFAAKIHVECSVKNNYAKFYFIEKPDLVWDLEVEVSSLNIPIHIEDMLDNRVEQEFEKINEKHPHEVKFAAEVKVRQKEWKGKDKKGFFGGAGSKKENVDEDGWMEEEVLKFGEDAETEKKRKKKKKKRTPKMHGTNVKKNSHSHMPHMPSFHTSSSKVDPDSPKKKKSSFGSSFSSAKAHSTPEDDPSEPLVSKPPPKKKSSFSFMSRSKSKEEVV